MKRLLSHLLVVALLLTCLSSCGNRARTHTENFFLMDTVITVTLYTKDAALARRQLDAARNLLTELERLWSMHRTDGDVARLNQATDSAPLTCDLRTVALLQQAQQVNRDTNGAFDVTLAPVAALWQSAAERGSLPTETEMSAALLRRGSDRLALIGDTVSKPQEVQLDLGGIGKGAAVSYLLQMLTASGVDGGLISFGSNVAVFGQKPDQKPYRIALRDPEDPAGTVGTLTLQDSEVLSVSGDYERYVTIAGQQYHHIIDPATGAPANSGLRSVAVICRDGALADALSTALFVMGESAAQAFYRLGIYQFEAIFISSSGEVTTTEGMTSFAS